jgi:hypothetical protein
LRELAAAGLIVLADKGYQGAADPVITPYKGKNKPESQKQANRSHARLRGQVNARTRSSRHGGSSESYVAAPTAPAISPRPIHVLQSHEAASW